MSHVTLSNGLKLRTKSDGPPNGEPLLLLNGSVFHLGQWDRLVNKGTWTSRFRVIRHDYADTGESGRRDGSVSMTSFVDELAGLMDALDIERAHLYGWSQGTIIAQAFADRFPDRIMSLGGYGWYHGDYSRIDETTALISARVRQFELLQELWDEPLTPAIFDKLWATVYRKALLGATYEELSAPGKLKDWAMRKMLIKLIAPTPIRNMHAWFDYCIRELEHEQASFRSGHAKLAEIPTLIQHARDDQTLAYGMAKELQEVIPNAKLITYEAPYHHVSIGFKTAHARRVVADHIAFLEQHTT